VPKRFALSTAAALLSFGLLTGCGVTKDLTPLKATASTAPAEGTASPDCTAVDGPLLTAKHEAGEPEIALPQPDGWERNESLDSQVIRLVIGNPSLTRNGFAPNIVITVGTHPSDVEAAFRTELAGMESSGSTAIGSPETTTICGYPARTAGYTAAPMGSTPARPMTTTFVGIEKGESSTFIVALVGQSTNPDDMDQLRSIIAGVQISGADRS